MQINDYIEVRDSINDALLLSGKISKITDNPAGYSVDGILFVNPNSNRLKITKVETPIKQIYNTVCQSDNYILYKHNNIDNTFKYDFFMWGEIEPEVKEVCELLNQIPGIETYSSCSGHGKIPPYVDFHVNNWDVFLDLLDFLCKQQQCSATYKHQEFEGEHRFVVGVEGKGTCHLEGLKINSNFMNLCKVLKKYIRMKI